MRRSVSQGLVMLVLALFALMAGFFYAFSVAVMPGLDDIDAHQSIRAMQGINKLVRNPVFFVTYFMTPVITVAVAMALYRAGDQPTARCLIAAAVTYGLGVLLPTTFINVPMNNALAAVDATKVAAGAQAIWAEYSSRWTVWNGVRAALSLCATLLVGFALLRLQK